MIKESKGIKAGERAAKILTFTALTAVALLILVPFYIIVITSFKHNTESMGVVFTWWPQEGFTIEGYRNVLFSDASGGGSLSTILAGFKNTLVIVVPATLLGLFVSAISAYSFAKIPFRIKNKMFSVLLATIMIPGVIMLTPSYLLYDMLGFVDTRFPLMVPGMFGSAACVFFMRQYYFGIPTDLVEAAKIDGLSHIKIFFQIMVPLSSSALIAQGVLGFVGGYNDYFGPLLYLQSPAKYTLQIALKNSVSTYGYDWQTVMSGAVIALIPTTVIYVFAQRFFIEGIATSGLKV
ncbi:MAG: carbohydrate ABC transporter permease [Clostridiales bacterium]|jgi:multiple sugar transport system permease protein|nr:carbohydrate ABC transporter permease [Clostridiales bacterium]